MQEMMMPKKNGLGDVEMIEPHRTQYDQAPITAIRSVYPMHRRRRVSNISLNYLAHLFVKITTQFDPKPMIHIIYILYYIYEKLRIHAPSNRNSKVNRKLQANEENQSFSTTFTVAIDVKYSDELIPACTFFSVF